MRNGFKKTKYSSLLLLFGKHHRGFTCRIWYYIKTYNNTFQCIYSFPKRLSKSNNYLNISMYDAFSLISSFFIHDYSRNLIILKSKISNFKNNSLYIPAFRYKTTNNCFIIFLWKKLWIKYYNFWFIRIYLTTSQNSWTNKRFPYTIYL